MSDRLKVVSLDADFNHIRALSGDAVLPYLQDESKLRGSASLVLLPKNEGEVAAIMREASSKGISVTVSAHRTGVVGGAVPSEGWVMSLEGIDVPIGVGRDDLGFYIQSGPCLSLRKLEDLLSSERFDGLRDLTSSAVEELKGSGRHILPVDPTETNASLGANVACNSSGAKSYRYGPMRDWVRRIRVVLPDGRLLDLTRGEHRARAYSIVIEDGDSEKILDIPSHRFNRDVKNSAGIYAEEGMDPIDLFIGSEGILGTITLLELRLVPWRRTLSSMAFFPDDCSAIGFVRALRSIDMPIDLIEYIDSNGMRLVLRSRDEGSLFHGMPDPPIRSPSAVIFDLPYDERVDEFLNDLDGLLSSHGSSLSHTWCAHEERERGRFRSLRHAVPEAVFAYIANRKLSHPGIHKMGTDMSVPQDGMGEMLKHHLGVLKESGLEYVMFGHLGDGHPHIELLIDDMHQFAVAEGVLTELASKVVELGGSTMAEHGTGRLKKEFLRLMYSESDLEEMVRLKKALDPAWVLNPGVMLEAPE